ncbi:MAG: hypothetical protein U0892_17205 [Pirellulales bacterium]
MKRYLPLVALVFALGCGGGASPPPSEEKVKELNQAMENDMKNMMQSVPKKPGS